MAEIDVFAVERAQLADIVERLGDLGVALGEFAADHGPLGDPTLHEACLLALAADGAVKAAWRLVRFAVEVVPDVRVETGVAWVKGKRGEIKDRDQRFKL